VVNQTTEQKGKQQPIYFTHEASPSPVSPYTLTLSGLKGLASRRSGNS